MLTKNLNPLKNNMTQPVATPKAGDKVRSSTGGTITYTTTGANGCSGSTTDIVVGLPSPNGGILGF